MRARAIAKLGLGYDQLREVKPDLIYCSAWGFGSGGPHAGQPAYDDALQGMSGLADLVVKHGADAPELAPSILVDKTTGLMTAAAIMMALFHHARTGEGQEVEVPMLETMTSFNLVEHLAGAVFEPATEPMGYARVLAPHRKCHRTADGYIVLLPYTTRQWRSFFTTAGRTDMLDDPRVNDPAWRSRHVATLYAMISEIMPARTTSEWLTSCARPTFRWHPSIVSKTRCTSPTSWRPGFSRRTTTPAKDDLGRRRCRLAFRAHRDKRFGGRRPGSAHTRARSWSRRGSMRTP